MPETSCQFTFFGECRWKRNLRETLRFVLRELRRRHPEDMRRLCKSPYWSWAWSDDGWVPLGSWLNRENLEYYCRSVLEQFEYPPYAFKAVVFDKPCCRTCTIVDES